LNQLKDIIMKKVVFVLITLCAVSFSVKSNTEDLTKAIQVVPSQTIVQEYGGTIPILVLKPRPPKEKG